MPTLGESSADNYFFSFATWNKLDTREHNAYIWAVDIFNGQGGQLDWNTPYQQVFYANVVLDGLGSQPAKGQRRTMECAGRRSLVFKGLCFLQYRAGVCAGV